jgi:peptidoglycan/LPS O-acetylase OafA/YrhL
MLANRKTKYFNQIDDFRAIAVLAVMVAHYIMPFVSDVAYGSFQFFI